MARLGTRILISVSLGLAAPDRRFDMGEHPGREVENTIGFRARPQKRASARKVPVHLDLHTAFVACEQKIADRLLGRDAAAR